MRACMGLGWGGGMRDGGWEMGDVTGVSPGEEEGDWFEGVGWLVDSMDNRARRHYVYLEL